MSLAMTVIDVHVVCKFCGHIRPATLGTFADEPVHVGEPTLGRCDHCDRNGGLHIVRPVREVIG